MEANFLISQVTTGIFCPGVPGSLMGAYTGIAVTDIEMTTGRTAPFDRSWALLEAGHERI
jgi:hypothetical protein